MANCNDMFIASQVPFQSFAVYCEKISKTQGKDKKKFMLNKFITNWRDVHCKQYGNNKTEDSFFTGMRFLLPHLDKDRQSYGMKEVVLAKYYIEALYISKESEDAIKVLNYSAQTSAKKDAGDFASVAYTVLMNRCPQKGSLSMDDIDKALDVMAQSNAEGRRDVIKKEIQRVIRSSTALEQKWIIRVMLKDMKLGMNENTILPLFHPEAMELYNVCNSLLKVCVDLHDIKTKLNEAEITLFSPFRPMLGQRTSLEDVEKLMNETMFIIETKIDGERMQLHKNNDEFRYYSRNANDYTQTFGATKYRGTFTPFIAESFKENIKTCILDGEMVGYDTSIKDFVLKGSNIDIKSDKLATGLQPCFVVFDVLLINGTKLANVPLKDRIKRAEEVFHEDIGRIQHVERRTGFKNADVTAAINEAIDRREEGIVIKDPKSLYKPSKRKGSGWLKLKPEYIDSLSDDLDLIILGGEYGSGHRGGIVSHFLLGVAATSEERPKTFMTVGKVGSGYTDKELKSLLEKLRQHWKKFDAKNPPSSIMFSNGCKEKPDVWIDPTQSVIVQIKAAEISKSDKYRAGFTLRFPRLEKIRDDKSWYDCMSITELDQLRKIADGKLTYQKAADNDNEPSKKKRKVTPRIERPRAVASHFQGADITAVNEVSQLLDEKEFCVINGSNEYPKQELEKKIAEHGGTFVQNPTSDTRCVLAHKTNFRVKNVISRGTIDVVSSSWLIECFERNLLVPYEPSHMLFSTEQTKFEFRKEFDAYEDSYTKDITPDDLKEVFSKMSNTEVINDNNIAELEERYFNDNSMGLFRRFRLYYGNKTSECTNEQQMFAQHEFNYHGGQIVDQLKNASHVLLDQSKSDIEEVEQIRTRIKRMTRKPHVISSNWIIDCIESNKLLNERAYGV